MRNSPRRDKRKPSQPKKEEPAIYSLGHVDDKPSFSRRTFLEVAAMVAGAGACAPIGLSGSRGGVGELGRTAKAHNEEITALAVSGTGRLLASADKGGTIRLWQLPEGAMLRSWPGHTSAVSSLFFPSARRGASVLTRDDLLWSVSSTGEVRRWSLPDAGRIQDGGDIVETHQNASTVLAAPIVDDWYAARSRDGKVKLRSQATDDSLVSIDLADERVNAIATTLDGRLVMAGGEKGNLGLWAASGGGGTPGAWSPSPLGASSDTASDGLSLPKFRMSPSPVSSVAMDPKGWLALTAHEDGVLRTWALPDLQLGRTFPFSQVLDQPLCMAIRPQLDLFAVGSEKHDIALWKPESAVSSPRLLKGHTAPVRAMVITPDGSLLISGSDDKTIRMWSLPDGRYLRNLVDLAVNYDNIKGVSYEGTDAWGRSVRYTLPCGSPIPVGAVCICNCVPGSISIPENHSAKYDSGGICQCDLICTCNSQCACLSVCRCLSVGGYSVSYWYPN